MHRLSDDPDDLSPPPAEPVVLLAYRDAEHAPRFRRERDRLHAAREDAATARDQLPHDENQLEPAFHSVCRRVKLRAIEEHLARIAKETAQTPGASELTDDARLLLEQRGQLLELKRKLMSQK